MNLYLRIKLYIMRRLFGRGPVDVVLGPMDRMVRDMGQVAVAQIVLGDNLANASDYAYNQGDKATTIAENFRNLMVK